MPPAVSTRDRSSLFSLHRPVDEHERMIGEFFKGRLDRAAVDIGCETVFVLFTNRCGSTYFGDLLRTSGLYNSAGEPLNWQTVVKRSEKLGLPSFAHYLRGLRRRAVAGRLALKASLGQFDFLRRAGLLDQVFPRRRVIVTERVDKIAQAVSWVIASQTLQWNSERQPDGQAVTPSYDFDAIQRYVTAICDTHRDMDIYLALHGETFCKVLYEDLVDDPVGRMGRVLRFLGHPDAEARPEEVRLKKQADSLNEEFRQRFIADLKERGSQRRAARRTALRGGAARDRAGGQDEPDTP